MEIVVKLVDDAERAYDALRDPILKKSVNRVLGILADDPFFGDPVSRKLWPKAWDLPNLFRAELSGFWRILYYVASDNGKTFVVVFEICDHKRYDKFFDYKK